MNEYRIRSSGAVLSEQALREHFEQPVDGFTKTLPAVLDAGTLGELGVDPVLPAPAPEVTQYQRATRSGVTQDALGNWVHAWVVEDWSEAEIAAAQAAAQQAILDARKKVLEEARSHRTAIFARIDGIQASYVTLATAGPEGGRAEAATIALAIEEGKVDLRNITLLDLSSATTYEQAKAIIMTEYKRIAAAAPVQVKSVYAGLDQ